MTPKRLRSKAFDLLSRRDHSEKELEDKLRSRGGEEADVAQVLFDMRDIGLLDDRKFAENFLSYKENKAWGPRRYSQELRSRGIAREIIDELMQGMDEGESGEVQDSKLQALVGNELRRGREPQKITASLVRRGFSYGDVADALRRAKADEVFGDAD